MVGRFEDFKPTNQQNILKDQHLEAGINICGTLWHTYMYIVTAVRVRFVL
jgi:hypothetical protein